MNPDSIDNSKTLSSYLPCIPWFGMDIGGTLVKIVYFEPNNLDVMGRDDEEKKVMNMINYYLTNNAAYGESGIRDEKLQMNNVAPIGITGNMHFIRFPTSDMNLFIKMAKKKNMVKLSTMICATGGGAYKFEEDFKNEVHLDLKKLDELDSLIAGIHLSILHNPNECYYYEIEKESSTFIKNIFNFKNPYPFLVVNIGSGVSFLAVRNDTDYERVTGSSLGGGTFLGLCSLLTGCKTFEDALDLAEKGNSNNVDKLVKDIYGGPYKKFNLQANTVASSFGLMSNESMRQKATKEDLASATLITITNNIGSIAKMCAENKGINNIVFVGNFLRINNFSMKVLTLAMDYWSNGKLKALFLEHEGYFGAIGCLSEMMDIDPENTVETN